MRHHPSSRAAAVLLLALAACAPQRVVVRGQEMPVQDAEALVRAELAAERAAVATLPPASRAARLEASGQARAPSAASAAARAAAARWGSGSRP